VSFRNRLSRLEKATEAARSVRAERQRRAEEQHSRLDAAWAVMQQTMSPEHARLVVDAYAAGAQDIGSPEYHTPAGRLMRRCLDAMSRLNYRHWPDTEIAAEVVLAMPPAVAEIYLKHDAMALHDCADCGFEVPITPGGNGVSAVRHFETCPLCGGRTGYAAYFLRRKAEADSSQQ
jgi:hypothetical protein